MFSYEPLTLEDIFIKRCNLFKKYLLSYIDDLRELDLLIRCSILNKKSRFSYFKCSMNNNRKFFELSFTDYLNIVDNYEIVVDHIRVRMNNYDQFDLIEEGSKKILLLLSKPIIEISNYAIEKGYNIETAYRIKNKKSKSTQIKKKLDDLQTVRFKPINLIKNF